MKTQKLVKTFFDFSVSKIFSNKKVDISNISASKYLSNKCVGTLGTHDMRVRIFLRTSSEN